MHAADIRVIEGIALADLVAAAERSLARGVGLRVYVTDTGIKWADGAGVWTPEYGRVANETGH